MKIKKFFVLLICLSVALGCACSETPNYEGKAKIVFNLEGGTYQNSQRAITHYYPIDQSGATLICDPESLTDETIERSGYHIEGWYKTKTQNGDQVEYLDKWNFESDKVGSEGVTLYAKWALNISFTYNVCYFNQNGEKVILGEYPVKAGEKFDDYANYAKRRVDGVYTPLGYVDENGNPWNEEFTHPGGEESLAIDVFVEYIEGRFEIVTTAKELKMATRDNIYLMADIDMGGETLSFENYKGKFYGNGHTISNFTINYDAGKNGLEEDMEDSSQNSLYVSLFGNTKDAEIKNVTFENVSINVSTFYSLTYKIYVAPLAINAQNTTFENVNFSGSCIVTKLPSGMDITSVTVKTNEPVFSGDQASVFENVSVNLTYSGQIEQE